MSEKGRSRREVLALGTAALLGSLAGCNGSGEPGDNTETESPQQREEVTPLSSSQPETGVDSPYQRVYQETIDSVVLVRTRQGQGTGFVFDESHVVTNAHVVGQASTVDIRFNGGRWSSGEVVGTDPNTDLAAIAVGGADIPAAATPLPFVREEPTPGQEVVAIGNPFNLNGTVTTGVVSGTDRSIPAPTGFRIPDAIQTDAAVNPGNSGGPLVSLDSRVVAVINSGGGDNIAFGISAALTQRVVPELIETGSYEHAYMGVSITDVTPEIADAMGMDEPRGLLVTQVRAGGPAAGALRPSRDVDVVDGRRVRVGGDVILEIGGTTVTTTEDVGSYLALRTRPGDTVAVTVRRDGSRETVEFELETRPS